MLLGSEDNETVAVACHDLGEFARFHRMGKRVVSNFGGKLPLMERLNHSDERVQREALGAVQKLFVRRWDLLHAGAASGRG